MTPTIRSNRASHGLLVWLSITVACSTEDGNAGNQTLSGGTAAMANDDLVGGGGGMTAEGGSTQRPNQGGTVGSGGATVSSGGTVGVGGGGMPIGGTQNRRGSQGAGSPGAGGQPGTGGRTDSGGQPSEGGHPGMGGHTTSGAGGFGAPGGDGSLGGRPGGGGMANQGGANGEGGAAGGEQAQGGNDGRGGAVAEGGGAVGGESGLGGSVAAPSFILGADISSTQESAATCKDTDGVTKSIFDVLKNHGFNYIRLKTFVDPGSPYGYASTENGCTGFAEPFGDKEHVIAYGKQIKAANMGFLLDFHYSDTWADPGNQIIPTPWRNAASITELAGYVKDYTVDVLTTAIAAGARPDMVQVGNEITPGLLMHVPGSNTDCWGNNPDPSSVSGDTSNWDDTATLLNAGIEAVRQVDPTIQIMLHIENTDDLNGVKWWVSSATSRGVKFDILGLSCYAAFQGNPTVWEATFQSMASEYPDLKFAIAEYNPERTAANRMIKNLPGGRGVGTFFWEPTRSGEWGDSMFSWSGGTQTANSADFAEYDAMLEELGL